MCELLLRKKADLGCVDERGDGPLHYAAIRSDLPVIEALVARGMPVDIHAQSGLTPLHYAAIRGNQGVSELLLSLGAAPTSHDRVFGSTPLHFAAMEVRGLRACPSRAISFAAVYPYFAAGRRSAPCMRLSCVCLHALLISQGHTPLGRILINKGADMNALTSAGESPLHDASGHGQATFCKMLLRRGANPRIRSNRGKTALDYAQARGYPACAAHLEVSEAKAKVQEAAERAAREEADRASAEEERARLKTEAAALNASIVSELASAPSAAAARRRRPSNGGSPKASPRSGCSTASPAVVRASPRSVPSPRPPRSPRSAASSTTASRPPLPAGAGDSPASARPVDVQ